MAGMAWQTTHVAGTYNMPVPINAIKTFQQPLVGQKQKDQTCSLVKKHALHYTNSNLHHKQDCTTPVRNEERCCSAAE